MSVDASHLGFTVCLKQAMALLTSEGIDSALSLLDSKEFFSNHHSSQRQLHQLMLLGQTVLPQNPHLALDLAHRALALDAHFVDAMLLMGHAHHRLGQRHATQLALKQVVTHTQASPDQVLQAAHILVRVGFQMLALKSAKKAFHDLGQPLSKASQLLLIAQKTANWTLADQLTLQMRNAYSQGLFDSVMETGRSHLNWCSDERMNLAVIRAWNERTFPTVLTHPPTPQPLVGRRLRVAYLSSDFRAHPMSRWIKGVFRQHDKSRIDLILYCSGLDDGSDIRKEVLSHAQNVHSITSLSDEAAAQLIRLHHIDVLIDLNGPTRGHRMGILALRPAPVQIHYIGFPGSVGGRLVDYVVGDHYLIPDTHHYPEKVIRLTKTYQVNDYDRLTQTAKPSRVDMKLPSGNWLIIGMFNGIEKVNSAVWTAWMQILKQVPNALLWLLDPGPAAQHHLSMSTQSHGVDPRRIVLAAKLPQNEHLSRLGLCDLMLDPWPYGGHTTTSDALFAGVPVVCKRGDNFAGRVSASLLHAAGLRDLVAEDVGQYIDLVVKLLRNDRERFRLKQYIADTVPKSDLFNIKSKTLQLEAAYHEAFNHALKGKAPESIDAVRLIHPE